MPAAKPCHAAPTGEGLADEGAVASQGLDYGQIKGAMDAFVPTTLRCVPDGVSEYAGQAGAHQALEVKVYNTIVSDAAQLLRGATLAFGATRAKLLSEILGDYADPAVVPPRHDGAPREAKYQVALKLQGMP